MESLIKLDEKFYLQDTLTVAKQLVGNYLVREIGTGPGAQKLIMEITETEAYIAEIDKACHAYNGKRTERTEVLYKKGGTIYVYLIYGMYYCLNIVTEREEKACAVLIRGAKPISSIDQISKIRYGKKYEELSKYQIKNFANGPGKLCKALEIDKSFNDKSILENEIYILKNEKFDTSKVKAGKRINIDYAEEAIDFLWRFYQE